MVKKLFAIPSLCTLLFSVPLGAGNESRLQEAEEIQEQAEQEAAFPEDWVAREYTIDISDHFVPEILRNSEHAEMYTADIEQLNERFGREVFHDPRERERFGMYNTFAPHLPVLEARIAHYQAALEQRGERVSPSITYGETIEHDFTTERTLEQIEELQRKERLSPQEAQQLQRHLERVDLVRDIQTILSWEGFCEDAIDGNYARTWRAVAAYQEFYGVESDGRIGPTTRALLNTSLEEQLQNAHHDVLNVFQERVFHATYVIDPEALQQVTEEAAQQLNITTPEEALAFFSGDERPEEVRLTLHVPERYMQESLQLRIEIIKSERNRRQTRMELYVQEDETETLLFSTRAVVGGEYVVRGRRRNFPTPTGDFYLRRVLVFPHWFPPSWAEEVYGDPITLPGFQNAFGIMASPLARRSRLPEDQYAAHYSGDLPFLLHLTSYPESVESGHGRSHGCVRVHPDWGNHVFYFLVRYTPHLPLGEAEYRGEAVPFERAVEIRIRR